MNFASDGEFAQYSRQIGTATRSANVNGYATRELKGRSGAAASPKNAC
jgi:hypothetical protein